MRSNQGDEPRVSNRRSTEIVPYKEQNNNDGSNKSSGHKGHGINIGMSAAGHRNMRPELRNNWRQALALKNESDDEEGNTVCRFLGSYILILYQMKTMRKRVECPSFQLVSDQDGSGVQALRIYRPAERKRRKVRRTIQDRI